MKSVPFFFHSLSMYSLVFVLQRAFEPPEVKHDRLFVISVAGFIVNLIGIFAFQHGGHGHSHGGGGMSVCRPLAASIKLTSLIHLIFLQSAYKSAYTNQTKMSLYRRMLKIKWSDKITNDEVLRGARTQRNIIHTIKSRKLRYFGHIVRHRLEGYW